MLSDSQAMKLTSVVALVVLPLMFVSAVSSTSFFDFDAGTAVWVISNNFWTFWKFTSIASEPSIT